LTYSLAKAATFCVVQEVDSIPSASTTDFLARLEPWLIETDLVQEWPGSALVDGEDHVLRYRFDYNAAVVETVISKATNVYAWQSPSLLDDPHLVRRDGSLWFGTTTTERWSWLELLPGELEELTRTVPEVRRLLVPGNLVS